LGNCTEYEGFECPVLLGYGTLSLMVTDFFLRRVLPLLSGSLLSENIAPVMKIGAESFETSVAIYRWHGVKTEKN
jgi:hypothetical protein